jgi:hypothetical protein
MKRGEKIEEGERRVRQKRKGRNWIKLRKGRM